MWSKNEEFMGFAVFLSTHIGPSSPPLLLRPQTIVGCRDVTRMAVSWFMCG